MEIKIRVAGIEHKAQAQLIKGDLWVYHQGKTFKMPAASGQKSRKKAGAGGSSDQVVAPMPGKITKILLNSGTAVAKGQAVLVMEAMKMEYTLKVEIEGTVEAIQCAVGDQVALGKVLVKIKPASDK